jgi:type I restriction enzyme S subunit
MNQLSLDSQIVSGAIGLGRGNIISSKDIAEKPGDYPIYSSSAQGKGEFGRYADYMFDEELITWSVDGGGRFFYRPKHRFSVTNVCGYLRTKDDFWDRLFVYYSLDFQHAKLAFDYQMKAHPSVIRHIYTLNEFTRLEQTKIAEILSTVDRAIEQTEALIAKQQRLKTGLMQDLLTRGIDEHGNLRSEQTHQFKDSPLGRIPVEWEVASLAELSCGGAQNGFFKKPELVGSGYKLINVSEIYQPFGIDTRLEKVERIDATHEDLQKYGVSEGDLFFTRSSLVLEGIAHCNIIREIHEPTLFECHVMRIRAAKAKIVPEYLALYCQSHLARLFLMSRAKHVTMTTISQPELEALPIAFPCNLTEQQAIANAALSSDSAIRQSRISHGKFRSLKTALMQDLLTGRKRVTTLLEEDKTSLEP